MMILFPYYQIDFGREIMSVILIIYTAPLSVISLPILRNGDNFSIVEQILS